MEQRSLVLGESEHHDDAREPDAGLESELRSVTWRKSLNLPESLSPHLSCMMDPPEWSEA